MQMTLFPENECVKNLDEKDNRQEHTRGTLVLTYGPQEDLRDQAAEKWPPFPSRSSARRSPR